MLVKNKGIFLVLATAFTSGVSIFLNKLGVAQINPFVFVGLKNFGVALFLAAILIIFKEKKEIFKLSKKQWFGLVLVGVIDGGVPFLLFFKGLSITSGAQASFWHKNMFLLVIPMAVIFLREKINKDFLIAGILLFAANLFLLKNLQFNMGIGDGLIILATGFWAVENIVSKNLLKSLSPRILAFGRMFFGSLIIFAFLILSRQVELIFSLSIVQMTWTFLTSVLLLGYVISWYGGLKHIKLSTAICILLLGGPITSLLSLVFLNQGLGEKQIISIVLTVIGVIFLLGVKRAYQGLRKIFPFSYVRA